MTRARPLHGTTAAKTCATLLSAALLVLTQGCSKREEPAELKAYRQQLDACSEQLQKDPLVPIIGGGHLDTRRLDFNATTVRFEDGECGTDGFETSFYWTGEKIVPAGQKFTGLHPTQIPKSWQQLNVAARLANRKFCRENPDKCKAALPAPPKEWPEEFTAHLRHYELDVRLPKEPVNYVTHEIGFLLREWPQEDGTPRFVMCDIKRDVKRMARGEIESLDFGQESFPCQADFFDFNFKGGAARVSMSTATLPAVTPALRALQAHISDSIHREDQQ